MASLYRKKCFLFISGSCDLDDFEYTILNAAHFLNVTANMKVIIFDFHNDLTKIASNHCFLPLNGLIVQYKNTHQIEDPFKSHTQSERKEKITIYRGDISKEPVLSGIEGIDFSEQFLSWINEDNGNNYAVFINLSDSNKEKLSTLEIGFLEREPTMVFCNDNYDYDSVGFSINGLPGYWGYINSLSGMYYLFYQTRRSISKKRPNIKEQKIYYLPFIDTKRIYTDKKDFFLDFENISKGNPKDFFEIFTALFND